MNFAARYCRHFEKRQLVEQVMHNRKTIVSQPTPRDKGVALLSQARGNSFDCEDRLPSRRYRTSNEYFITIYRVVFRPLFRVLLCWADLTPISPPRPLTTRGPKLSTSNMCIYIINYFGSESPPSSAGLPSE